MAVVIYWVLLNNRLKWLTDALTEVRTEGAVDAQGCALKFFKWGKPNRSESAKNNIVMLHGFLSHSRCFSFIAPFLAHGREVVAYDHSGMGDSGWRDEYNEDIRVNELLAVCESTGMFVDGKKPVLVTHSYGGRVAIAAVHAHPEKFSGLIICDLMIIRPEVLKRHADAFRPPGGKRDVEKPNVLYPDYSAAKKRFVLSPAQEVDQKELFDFMAYHSLKKVTGGWQWKFDPKVFKQTQVVEKSWATVGQKLVTAPIQKVVVYGEESVLFPNDSLSYLEELALQYEVQPIPTIGISNARHHLMLDQPITLVSALKAILERWG